MKEMYAQLGISSEVYDFGHKIEESLKERFEKFDKTAEYNQMKVLLAMQKNKVSAECFGSSSGYGYDDKGRDTLDQIYADIFGTIPIAEALLAKGALLGVVLSFMMAVTTLSLPSMIMLRKAVKPRLLGIFAAICTMGIIVVGYFFNAIQTFII